MSSFVPGLEFFRDVVLSGTICGLALGDDQNRVVAQLGGDFVVEGDDRNCLYDYGLVEVYWSRPTTTEPWCLTGYSIEAMRLVHGTDIPQPLCGYHFYRVTYTDLAAALVAVGVVLEDDTNDGDRPTYRRYRYADSRVLVIVVDEAAPGDVWHTGDVWSISTDWHGGT